MTLTPLRGLAASILAMLGLAGGATAATVVVDQTLDLSSAGFASSGFTYAPSSAFSPAFSVQLAVGDTFDFTINFLGAQSLTLSNPSLLWAYAYSNQSSDVTGTGRLELLDAHGAVSLSSNPKTDTEGVAHFGQNFDGSDFSGGLPASLTFSGMRYVGTVDAYATPGLTVRTHDSASFAFSADAHLVSGVPEPESVLLMLAGLGVLALCARRRTRLR